MLGFHLLGPQKTHFPPLLHPPLLPKPPFVPKSPHQLQLIIRRPSRLGETEAALDALQELAGDLIAHDVRLTFVALVQFLARRALVDAYHGDADGPGSVQG